MSQHVQTKRHNCGCVSATATATEADEWVTSLKQQQHQEEEWRQQVVRGDDVTATRVIVLHGGLSFQCVSSGAPLITVISSYLICCSISVLQESLRILHLMVLVLTALGD